MLKSAFAMVVALTVLMMAVAAAAQDAPSGRWWLSSRVAGALKLTKGEIQQLEQAYEQSRLRMIELKSKVEREQFELSRMLEQRNLEETAIRAQNRRLENARSDLAEARFSFVIDVRRIIGAQRFQQLLDLKP